MDYTLLGAKYVFGRSEPALAQSSLTSLKHLYCSREAGGLMNDMDGSDARDDSKVLYMSSLQQHPRGLGNTQHLKTGGRALLWLLALSAILLILHMCDHNCSRLASKL